MKQSTFFSLNLHLSKYLLLIYVKLFKRVNFKFTQLLIFLFDFKSLSKSMKIIILSLLLVKYYNFYLVCLYTTAWNDVRFYNLLALSLLCFSFPLNMSCLRAFTPCWIYLTGENKVVSYIVARKFNTSDGSRVCLLAAIFTHQRGHPPLTNKIALTRGHVSLGTYIALHYTAACPLLTIPIANRGGSINFLSKL